MNHCVLITTYFVSCKYLPREIQNYNYLSSYPQLVSGKHPPTHSSYSLVSSLLHLPAPSPPSERRCQEWATENRKLTFPINFLIIYVLALQNCTIFCPWSRHWSTLISLNCQTIILCSLLFSGRRPFLDSKMGRKLWGRILFLRRKWEYFAIAFEILTHYSVTYLYLLLQCQRLPLLRPSLVCIGRLHFVAICIEGMCK